MPHAVDSTPPPTPDRVPQTRGELVALRADSQNLRTISKVKARKTTTTEKLFTSTCHVHLGEFPMAFFCNRRLLMCSAFLYWFCFCTWVRLNLVAYLTPCAPIVGNEVSKWCRCTHCRRPMCMHVCRHVYVCVCVCGRVCIYFNYIGKYVPLSKSVS